LARAPRPWALYVTVFLIATAGLVYELVAGAVASYVLGDSVTQFSLVIGLYLSALGVGAYVSRFVQEDVARRFVDVELATALIGGVSAPLLLFAFARGGSFSLVLWGVVLVTGVLVGLELPLLMRLLRERVAFEDLIAKALFFDYLGALAASVLFALVLVPTIGLVRTSLVFGLLNAGVGLASTWLLENDDNAATMRAARVRAGLVTAFLVALLTQSERLVRAGEVGVYGDSIWYAEQSAYQRIVLTKTKQTTMLFLNGNLQFSSADERRYHEALVHPAMAVLGRPPKRVLIAGGGDGLAAREVLRYPTVERVVLVDLDPAMTRVGATLLGDVGAFALGDPRVVVVNEDAAVWMQGATDRFDVAFVDLPDPNNLALGKLYTTRFYRAVAARLEPGGALTVQATSPMYSRASFWSVVATLEAAGLAVRPYHAFVPAFGEWGFALASASAFPVPERLVVAGLTYVDDARLSSMFRFPGDMARVDAAPSRLDTQSLVRTYEREIGRYTSP
jgi:spermidine synthase